MDQGPLYQCKSCKGDYPATSFYSSNGSRCKECVKLRVRANRAKNAEYYRSYDRMRYRESDERKARCIAAGKATPMSVRVEKQRDRRRVNPEKNVARLRVARAISRGQIKSDGECFFCKATENIQAHHPDYSKPLDVFWLCSSCHGKLHTVNGDFHRHSGRGS